MLELLGNSKAPASIRSGHAARHYSLRGFNAPDVLMRETPFDPGSEMAASGNHAVSAESFEASPSSSARDLLLRRISDLAVLPLGRMTPQERSLVDTVMASAVARLEVPARRHLAERVAKLPEGPVELTLALARDTIDVAEPVLRDSQGMQASDLVQIVRDAGADHQRAISERKTLPGAVVDALIDYGSAEAICRMLANPAAEMSARAIETLVRRSATEPSFQPLLMARPELTARLAQLMFWWMSPEARKDILMRHSIERRMMHLALDEVLDAGLAASGTDDALRVMLSLLHPPVAMPKPHLARLLDLANRLMREEFTAELALAGRIRPETAFRIVDDLGGEPLAVFGKANGLSRTEFGDLLAAVARLRTSAQWDKSTLERITTIFDAISTDRADQVLHSWDWTISAEAKMPADG
jgi:hypothetical protein